MVKNVYITGQGRVGKTLIAIALASKIRGKDMKVAYFKPVGELSLRTNEKLPASDADAILMKQELGMSYEEKQICPIVRTMVSHDEFLRIGQDEILNRIRRAYATIAKGMDYVIIEGARSPWSLLHVNAAAPQLAKEFNAEVISIVNFSEFGAIDDVFLYRDFFAHYGVEEINVVLNSVPPMLRESAIEKLGPMLEDSGIHYLGTIVQHKELVSPSIRDIQSALEGRMIVGEEKLDVPITHFLVGNMAPENALKWFRQSKNKAVITSGDRADICLTAMETDTHLLVLTGNLGPDVRTVARARETDTAIMVTDKDTFTTSQIVDRLVGSIHPDDRKKIKAIEQIVGESLDLSRIGI